MAYMQESVSAMALFLAPAGLLVATYLAPSFATLHNLSQPRSRATITAIAGIFMSLIGASLGPLIGGISIDLLGEYLFNQAGYASFATVCPGGLPGADYPTVMTDLCRPVLARATQLSLLCWAPLMIWPAFHFWLASRTIRGEERV
jgi:MFS family permease